MDIDQRNVVECELDLMSTENLTGFDYVSLVLMKLLNLTIGTLIDTTTADRQNPIDRPLIHNNFFSCDFCHVLKFKYWKVLGLYNPKVISIVTN